MGLPCQSSEERKGLRDNGAQPRILGFISRGGGEGGWDQTAPRSPTQRPDPPARALMSSLPSCGPRPDLISSSHPYPLTRLLKKKKERQKRKKQKKKSRFSPHWFSFNQDGTFHQLRSSDDTCAGRQVPPADGRKRIRTRSAPQPE